MTNTTHTNVSTEPSAKPKAIPCVVNLDLRDYFAAQAMKTHMWALSRANLPDWNGEIARLSYLVADAMLAERKKP